MNNKKTLKNILEEKINQEVIYENILKKQKMKRKQIGIGLLIPACFFILFSFFFLQTKEEKMYKETNSGNKIELNIIEENENYNSNGNTNEKNYSNSLDTSIKDTKYRVVNSEKEITLPFKELVLPDYLENTENKILYEKEEIVGYQKNYSALYSGLKGNRYFNISIFKGKLILEEEKLSTINNVKCRITRYSTFYSVLFNYEEYQVGIRTSVTEEELVAFLGAL